MLLRRDGSPTLSWVGRPWGLSIVLGSLVHWPRPLGPLSLGAVQLPVVYLTDKTGFRGPFPLPLGETPAYMSSLATVLTSDQN